LHAQADIPPGGLNAHCIDIPQCDFNIDEKKNILGAAIGVQNSRYTAKGKGKRQGKWTCKGTGKK
jgi:hypothetical protein